MYVSKVCRCGDEICSPDCSGGHICGGTTNMRIYAVDSFGVSHWSKNEPDNHAGYDACLVLTQVYGLEWGDVQCFHADLAGYGFLCEYDLTQSNCLDKYAAGKCYSVHGASKRSWFDVRWTCAENGGELLQVRKKYSIRNNVKLY
ncbi:hypothetical protein NP493_117g03001 [Ridgeia piscesae]|uniref:Uncharacterized protein n=1 Tax=Ridgeia piscesae TaxID=27915 RepID=A0AAD9UGV8_RIDPI|nr:hypothetical protein NP493_117g03001 [Ridgeia piscesae]